MSEKIDNVNITEEDEGMDGGRMVLCGANSYDRKYYLNPDFASLPKQVRDELQIACVIFCEKAGGMVQIFYDGDGNIKIRTSGLEHDYSYDEIGSALMVRELLKEKQELFASLELYYRLMVKGQEEDE